MEVKDTKNIDDAVELAIAYSMETLRSDRNAGYTFEDHKIIVTTLYNNGKVYGEAESYSNKCAFISISQGLKLKLDIDISPFELMEMANFKGKSELLDTDKPSHKRCLDKLVEKIPFVRLEFYFGVQSGGN